MTKKPNLVNTLILMKDRGATCNGISERVLGRRNLATGLWLTTWCESQGTYGSCEVEGSFRERRLAKS
jgi:hypothetical protein